MPLDEIQIDAINRDLPPEGTQLVGTNGSSFPQTGVQSEVARLSESVQFVNGDLKGNFEKLRDHYSLNEGGHKNVSTLISGFTVVFESGSRIECNIPDNNSSKPGLLLYHFAGNRDKFHMDDALRVETRKYFGTQICDGTAELEDDKKYTPIALAILEPGVTIEIRKPTI